MRVIFIIVFLALSLQSYCSIKYNPDSLLALIDTTASEEIRIRTKSKLADYYLTVDIYKAIALAKTVVKDVASSGLLQDWKDPYEIIRLGYLHMNIYDTAIYYGNFVALIYTKNPPSPIRYFMFYRTMGNSYDLMGDYNIGRKYLDSAEIQCKKIKKNTAFLADLNWFKGIHYAREGHIDISLKFSLKAMRYYEQLKDSASLAAMLHNVAVVYFDLKKVDKAKEMLLQSEKINLKKDWKLGVANNRAMLAELHVELGQYTKSYMYLNSTIEIYKEVKKGRYLSYAYSLMGWLFVEVYNVANKDNNFAFELNGLSVNSRSLLDSALFYYSRGAMEAQRIGSIVELGDAYTGMSRVALKSGDNKKAVEMAEKALDALSEYGSLTVEATTLGCIIDAYGNYAKELADKSDYKTAVKYYTKVTAFEKRLKIVKDSMLTEVKIKESAKEANKYELDLQNIRHENENRERKLTEAAKEKQLMIIIISVSFGAIMLIVFLVLLYRRFKKSKLQNLVIARQKQNIEIQRDQLQESNKQVRDSINYASRIQASLLPDKVETMFADLFVYYNPRDVVSGDFYWSHEDTKYKFLVVADCTGHGVPGAFMSVLGISMLDKIVGQMRLSEPHKILAQLSVDISQKLQKEGDMMSSDGMDISLIRIDKETNQLLYCGVGNDLIIRKPDKTIRLKCEILPIGLQMSGMDYTDQVVQLEKGDWVFMFTDGFADQFSGESGKKIGFNKFESLLLDHSHQSMKEICEALRADFEILKGDRQQIDDLCIIGFEA